MFRLTKWYFLVASLLAFCYHGVGQYDTIRRGDHFKRALANKALPMPKCRPCFLECLLLDRDLDQNWGPGNSVLTLDSPYLIQNCVRYQNNGPAEIYEQRARDSDYLVNLKSTLELKHLSMADGEEFMLSNLIANRDLRIINNEFTSLQLLRCRGIGINIDQNDIEDAIYLYKNPLLQNLNIFNNYFHKKRSGIVSFRNTYRSAATIYGCAYENLKVFFEEDSILGSLKIITDIVSVNQTASIHRKHRRFSLVFKNSYIDSPIVVGNNADTTTIEFDHCSFGPNANVLDFLADTLKFINCKHSPSSSSLHMRGNRDTCWLEVVNSNFASMDFLYTPLIHLTFDSPDRDTYTSSFEGLLAKFKREGKRDSYERLDIEYHNYKARMGSSWDRVLNWLEREWWNYGYSKSRVIIWTFWILMFFFVFNVFLWKQMQEIYPIVQEVNFIDRGKQPVLYQFQKFVRIFLYTAYIFFSVKIDLSKLKVTNFLLVTCFFFQFLVGLWCLFFIVNALLKIG